MTDDNLYKKGFNEGYIITKHLPGLATQLSEVKNETPRMEGFRDGRKELLEEKSKERLPHWLKKDISHNDKLRGSKDQEREIEKE